MNFDAKFSVQAQNFKQLFLPFHFCIENKTLTRYSEEMVGGIMFKPSDSEPENTSLKNGLFDCGLKFIFIFKSNLEFKMTPQKWCSSRKSLYFQKY